MSSGGLEPNVKTGRFGGRLYKTDCDVVSFVNRHLRSLRYTTDERHGFIPIVLWLYHLQTILAVRKMTLMNHLQNYYFP